MDVIWSPEAQTSYEKAVLNILSKWSVDIVEQFESEVNNLTDRLSKNKKLCPPSSTDKKLRRCVISKQTSIIYEIQKKHIEILLIIDNRSDHKH